MRKRILVRGVIVLVLLAILAACGSTGGAEPSSQFALAATAAADTTNVARATNTVVAPPTQATVASVVPTANVLLSSTATPGESSPEATGVAQATVVRATSIDIIEAAETAVTPTPVASQESTAAPAITPTATLATAAPTAAPPTAVAPEAPPAAPATIACDEPCAITFTELYSGASITGPTLSDKAVALSGRKVVMLGYMAPPLSPDTTFFVLTKTPLVYCPFCNTAADWPFDIVYVKMAGGRSIPTLVPTQGIKIVGTFEVGSWTDPETGFVSLVRIFAEDVQVIS